MLKKTCMYIMCFPSLLPIWGAQWLSGRVLDSRPRGRGFEPHRRHCVVSLSKNINPSLVLVRPRKTRPFITERLLMGRKESNQTNKNKSYRFKKITKLCQYTEDMLGKFYRQYHRLTSTGTYGNCRQNLAFT